MNAYLLKGRLEKHWRSKMDIGEAVKALKKGCIVSIKGEDYCYVMEIDIYRLNKGIAHLSEDAVDIHGKAILSFTENKDCE